MAFAVPLAETVGTEPKPLKLAALWEVGGVREGRVGDRVGFQAIAGAAK